MRARVGSRAGRGRRGAPTPGSGRAGPARRRRARGARRRARRPPWAPLRPPAPGAHAVPDRTERRAWRGATPSSTSDDERVCPREEPGGDRVLDQGRGCEPASERLDREGEVEQGGAGTARGLGHRHARRAHGDEVRPELGREADRLVVAEAVEGDGALGESPEHVDDRPLLVASGRDPRSSYITYRCSSPPAWPRTPSRAGHGHDARRDRARSTSTARGSPTRELDRRARAWARRIAARGVAGRRPRRHDAAQHLRRPRHDARRSPGCGSSKCRSTSRSPGGMLAYALDHADVHDAGRRARVPSTRSPRSRATCPSSATVVVLDEASRAGLDRGVDAGSPTRSSSSAREYRDVHSLMFTSGTTGPSKAVITPWAVMYQFWSWVPDDTLVGGRRAVLRDAAVPQLRTVRVQLRHGARRALRARATASAHPTSGTTCAPPDCVTAALVGPMTALLYSAPPRARRRRLPAAQRDPRSDDPGDRSVRAALRCARRDRLRADRDRHGRHDRVGPRPVGRTAGASGEDYPWPEVRIVDEHDEPVADGEVGELLVRSAEPWALNVGYHKMPEQTAEAWRNGWFHTGDAFRRDADGWYYFVDRLPRHASAAGARTSRRSRSRRSWSSTRRCVECAAIGVPAPLGEDDVFVAVIVDDPATFDPAAAARVPRAAHAPVHAARATSRWSTTCPRTEASMRRAQARAARPRGHRHHLGPRGLLIWLRLRRNRHLIRLRLRRNGANICSCPPGEAHHPPRRPRRVLRLGRAARRPPPAGPAVIVGGGVVMCASYEARACGVRGAMGGREAKRLCPDPVVVPPRMSRLHRGEPGGVRRLRRHHAIRRGDLGRRGVPRRQRPVADLRHAGGDRGQAAPGGAGTRRSADQCRRRPHEVPRQGRQCGVEAGWAARRAARSRARVPAPAADRARSGVSAPRPRPSSTRAASHGRRHRGDAGAGARRHPRPGGRAPPPRARPQPRPAPGADRSAPRGRSDRSARSGVVADAPDEVDAVARRHRRPRDAPAARPPGASGEPSCCACGSTTSPASPVRHPADSRPPTPHAPRHAARRLLDDAQTLVDERGLTLVGVTVSNLSDDTAVQLPLPFHGGLGPALDHTLDAVRDRFGGSSVGRAALLGKDHGWSMPLLPDPSG